jgi:FKBP-type peptidyl-prolyl cis-trans isomerase
MQETKFSWLGLLGYIALIAALTFGVIYVMSYKAKEVETTKMVVAETTPVVQNSPVSSNKPMQKDVTELKIEDLVVGTGAEAVSGKLISVNYTGTLTDGTKFDSSLNPGRTPFEFTLGAGDVIQGWDMGFAGMKIGGKRKLTIPSDLGYGLLGVK